MSEDLLPYYNSELAYIRRKGDEFARSYPKIAQGLRLNTPHGEDPHVERLIEAFAFLTARVHKKLDDDFPEIAQSFVNVVAPRFLAPVPSMTIVQFHLDRTAGKLSAAYEMPRHSVLESEPVDGRPCLFRTSYPVTLWPLTLQTAELSGPPFSAPTTPVLPAAKSILKLRLTCDNKDLPVGNLGVDRLRFYLTGPCHYVHQMYELLFSNALGIAVATGCDDPQPRFLPQTCLQTVGFDEDQELLPRSPQTGRCYQMLSEYFALPEKFLFFDIVGLKDAWRAQSGGATDIYLYFDRGDEDLQRYVSADMFRMGCTPAVNLFSQTAEPIALSHEASEYQVIPDARSPSALEVFSVDRVTATDGAGDRTEILPLYSIKHGNADGQADMFWNGSRRQGRRTADEQDGGTDLFLSFTDQDLDFSRAADRVLTVETTCLNRDLPGRLPFGAGRPEFRLQQGGPIRAVECLTAPTATYRPQWKQLSAWRLISTMSLNHLSISGGSEGVDALREILKVHDIAQSAEESFPYDGILSIDSRRVVGRLDGFRDLPRLSGAAVCAEPGFCRGLEITLELDEDRFVGAGMFLFATVMERFFGLYASVNSFSKLVLRTKQRKELQRWSPRAGAKILH